MTTTKTTQTPELRNEKGHFIGDSPMVPIVDALNDCYKAIRARHSDLGNAVLVVGASGKRRNSAVHGHFSPDTWSAKNAAHEIMLSGESLERGAEATLGTLLHESAHLLAHARGIKDTSRQGRFHNKRFKALAEEVGVEVHNDPTIGWSVTTLPKATAELYKKELSALRKALKAYRIEKPKAVAAKRTIRLVTPSGRGLTVLKSFYEAGDIVDAGTGEVFEPVEKETEQ